jgi:hypothetical protein
MRIHPRTAAALGVTSVVAGAVLAGAHAQAGAATGARQVLHLHGQINQETLVDAVPSGPSLGDEQVASGRLTDSAGKRVGSFGFTCTDVRVTHREIAEQCAGWGHLHQGDLTVSGMSRYTDTRHVWAVTGGTGALTGSGGTVVIVDRNDNREDLTITLQ